MEHSDVSGHGRRRKATDWRGHKLRREKAPAKRGEQSDKKTEYAPTSQSRCERKTGGEQWMPVSCWLEIGRLNAPSDRMLKTDQGRRVKGG